MKSLLRYLFPLAALALAACDGRHEAPAVLSPEAAAEYQQLCEREESDVRVYLDRLDENTSFFEEESEFDATSRRMAHERLELLEAFEKSGDVTLATPMVRHTLLQMAVQHRMETLVDELLRLGADPNAAANYSYYGHKELDAPLVWAVTPSIKEGDLTHKPYSQTAIRLLNRLVAAGARADGDAGGHALLFCTINAREGGEEVYLHLLELGANPRLGYMRRDSRGLENEYYVATVFKFLLRARWPRALEKLIDMGHLPIEWRNEDMKTLLFCLVEAQVAELRLATLRSRKENLADISAEVNEETTERLALIRLLLERGANPNAPQGGGWTPLTYAACLPPDEAAFAPAWQELIDLLIKHGGDPNATVPAHGGEPTRRVSEWLGMRGLSI